MDTENYLFSVDGPNGIGKGGILQRARVLLEVMNFINFAKFDDIPFRTASITEPPQLPLYAYSSHPAARMPNGQLMSWRNLLKEGYGKELLRIGTPGVDAIEIAYAEGFLTSRAIIERYMFEEFPWTFGCNLNPFINMLPNIFTRIPGGNLWFNVPFSKVVVKDRGSASTAVFQGVDPRVRTLMEQMYESGDLMMEDLTVLLLPTDRERWIHTVTSRLEDRDVHDGKFQSQADRYFGLRFDWGGVFSKNIVQMLNDPSGETNNIETPSFLLSLLFLVYKQNRGISWFDDNQQLNQLTVSFDGIIPMLQRTYHYEEFTRIGTTLSQRVNFEFQGIPLTIVSGDIGLVSQNDNPHMHSLVIAEDLYKRVNSVK